MYEEESKRQEHRANMASSTISLRGAYKMLRSQDKKEQNNWTKFICDSRLPQEQLLIDLLLPANSPFSASEEVAKSLGAKSLKSQNADPKKRIRSKLMQGNPKRLWRTHLRVGVRLKIYWPKDGKWYAGATLRCLGSSK